MGHGNWGKGDQTFREENLKRDGSLLTSCLIMEPSKNVTYSFLIY